MKFQVDLELEDSPTSNRRTQSSETQSASPTKVIQPPDNKTHVFQEHVFKKPTFCDVCNHMIVGKTYSMVKIVSYVDMLVTNPNLNMTSSKTAQLKYIYFICFT